MLITERIYILIPAVRIKNTRIQTFRFLADIPLMRHLIPYLMFVFALLPAYAVAQDSELFPRPPEIEPAVNFWVRIYTEVDTQSGFLHDAQNLGVVYASMPLNRRAIEARRTGIQEDLRALATGKREQLSERQAEVLASWPPGVSNQTLRAAASNVRWQLGQSDRFLGGLQRSGAYRQHINDVLREKGLPLELGVLPHVESSFNPGAYSSAAAAGMWQFTRPTGKRFMRIDHIVDERMDPYMATNAAMSLLEYNYSVLGSWPLALTAYNHGAAGIARAVRETKTSNIEVIIANYKGRRFGFASRNFYPQFLAVLQVENNAQRYFGDIRLNPAPEFQEVLVDAFVDAEVFASSIGISLEQLRDDNRALRPVVWEGGKRIPKGFVVKVREEAVPEGNLMAMINSDFKFPVQTPDIAYVVERGDSLSVIANRFNTTVAKLSSMNQLASRHRIQIGQRLLLPQDNATSIQLAVASPSVAPSNGAYVVRRGDTVSLIAARYGVNERALLGINGIQDPHRIYPGQQIKLPGFEANAGSGVAIAASLAPVAPVQIQFSEQSEAEVIDVAIRIEEPTVVAVKEQPEPVTSGAPQLALNEEPSPPAAVLPYIEELEPAISDAEGEAVALDPALDVTESNEQLNEALSADPSDYTVASNNTVEIQASETLGHFADWLGLRAWDIRRLNNMAFRDPVIISKRLKLDFSKVNIAEFELRRRDFHVTMQQEFFSNYRIQNVEQYQVKRNDNVGNIARNRYSTPVWLLRQYNPGLDFNRIQIGQEIVFPLVERVQ